MNKTIAKITRIIETRDLRNASVPRTGPIESNLIGVDVPNFAITESSEVFCSGVMDFIRMIYPFVPVGRTEDSRFNGASESIKSSCAGLVPEYSTSRMDPPLKSIPTLSPQTETAAIEPTINSVDNA